MLVPVKNISCSSYEFVAVLTDRSVPVGIKLSRKKYYFGYKRFTTYHNDASRSLPLSRDGIPCDVYYCHVK